jgi:hypothetical protein
MSFDEELRRTLDELADRLRAEHDRALDSERAAAADRVNAAIAEAEAASLAALDEGIRTARDEALRIGREDGIEAGREEGMRTGREEGREEARKEGIAEGIAQGRREESEAGDRVLESIRAIDAARSLSEILDALALASVEHASRAAVLVVNGARLAVWRAIGFPGMRQLDEGSAAKHDVSLADAGLIADAVQSQRVATADGADSAALPLFARTMPEASSASRSDSVAIPISLGGNVVAALYANDANESADQHRSVGWQGRLEILARHAARSLEAVTAFRAAAVATTPVITGGSAATSTDQNRSLEEGAESARRYARLLISEIKLYHEDDLLVATRERDLTKRLGGEIARARVLYDQRVPADVRQTGDYFYAELVRTLANGDASLLEATG